jgi:hypothetical protein
VEHVECAPCFRKIILIYSDELRLYNVLSTSFSLRLLMTGSLVNALLSLTIL